MSTVASTAGAALRAVLDIDTGFATSPDRLRRALLDLLPDDERAGRLIALGATLAVPDLLSSDRVIEARHRLFDQAGLRPEVVDWIIAVWQLATGGGVAAAGAGTGAPNRFSQESEKPGTPTALRLAVWPDGAVLAAVVAGDGVFAATVPVGARPVWRRVAAPSAPSSRDVAIGLHDDTATGIVSWTDSTGVGARTVTPDPAGGLSLGEPRPIVTGGPARYPLAVHATGADVVDVLWTADRDTMRRTVLRSWATDPDVAALPALERPGERFTGLDLAPDGDRGVWLAARTDRDRVLVTRWDLAIDDIPGWTAVASPAGGTGIAIVAVRGGCVLVACSTDGSLRCLDVAAAAKGTGEWSSVRRPPEVAGGTAARLVAGAGRDGRGWLAVTDDSGTWLAPVGRRGADVVLGPARPLWLG